MAYKWVVILTPSKSWDGPPNSFCANGLTPNSQNKSLKNFKQLAEFVSWPSEKPGGPCTTSGRKSGYQGKPMVGGSKLSTLPETNLAPENRPPQ